MNTKYACIVYQAGISNVFRLSGMNYSLECRKERLLQSSFKECEAFARGLVAAGAQVTSVSCNKAGDVSKADWCVELSEAPFSDKFNPVFS